jgi:hypothetical protein
MNSENDAPRPKKGAMAFCLIFFAFASLVSVVIWWTSKDIDLIDYLFILGSPLVFGAVAYFIGLYVSDDAYGA